MVEHTQQLVLVRLQPFEQPVETDVAGDNAEERVKPLIHDELAQRDGAFPVAG